MSIIERLPDPEEREGRAIQLPVHGTRDLVDYHHDTIESSDELR